MPENAQPPPSSPTDTLQEIFRMQEMLNDHIFKEQGLTTPAGMALRMRAIIDAIVGNQLGVNDLPNIWLARYADALSAELDELKSDLLWKWWSKDRIDLQNIRVELIDILHFLVSAMLAAGLTSDDVYRLYRQKHAVNTGRQAAGYSQATKDDSDNKSIT